MLVNAILGFLLGYAFVASLPYLWLGLKVLWELITSVAGLFQAIRELFRNKANPSTNTPNTPTIL